MRVRRKAPRNRGRLLDWRCLGLHGGEDGLVTLTAAEEGRRLVDGGEELLRLGQRLREQLVKLGLRHFLVARNDGLRDLHLNLNWAFAFFVN